MIYKTFNLMAILFIWASSIIISITYAESLLKSNSKSITYKNVTEINYIPHLDSEWMSEVDCEIAMLNNQLMFLLEKSKNEIRFENEK